jgi:O-antigen ligase
VLLAVGLALLAAAWGGGQSAEAAAVVGAGIGLAAIIFPAIGLRPRFVLLSGVLLLACLDWAWPASWAEPMEWRQRLVGAGFNLGPVVSPEPWVSAHGWLVLLAGLVWTGWCAGQIWTQGERRQIVAGLAAGIGVVAAVAVAARGHHVPGWPAVETGLGPFANRNQTATLYATGAFLAVVLGIRACREEAGGSGQGKGRTVRALGWLVVAGVQVVALGLNRSRSGPLLLGAMMVLWVMAMAPRWWRRPETLGAIFSGGLILGTVFLFAGEPVIGRLTGTAFMDFRLKIYEDTAWLIRASPAAGVGLGCFDAVFPLYRSASVLQERVLHPESDWLWLTAEAGLPALAAAVALLGWLAWRAWRGLLRRGDSALQRALCVVAAVIFAHSLYDVPGHRLGTFMTAALLLGLAAAGPAPVAAESAAGWRILRAGGLGVFALGLAGMVLLGLRMPVTLAGGAERVKRDLATAVDPLEITRDLNVAMRWKPLDWQLYAYRAGREGNTGQITDALGDFRRARFLEPNYAGLPFEEGIYWLRRAPRFAIEPWGDALKRTARERRPEFYQLMLERAYPNLPDLRPDLWSLAGPDSGMRLVYLGWATPEDFKVRLGEVLHEDPGLSKYRGDDLKRLFEDWSQKGDVQQMAFLLERHPEWLRAGYRPLAEYDAAHGDVADAVRLMEAYLQRPQRPPVLKLDIKEADRRFLADPGDVAAGIAEYQRAAAAKDEPKALAVLRRMSGEPHCPGYVHYAAAQLLLKHGDMATAWSELRQCND